jgi:hypothetical protein
MKDIPAVRERMAHDRRPMLPDWSRSVVGRLACPELVEGSVVVVALVGLLLWPIGSVAAAEAPCWPAEDAPMVTAAPDDGRSGSLPRPFQTQPWGVDAAQLLANAQQQAAAELDAAGAPNCYAALLPGIAARTGFLSPYEFLVVGYYEHDWDTRDGLLRLYRDDPQQAVRRLADIWPSPRAELLIRTPAFFDLDTNQVYVNRGAVTPDQAPNVVVHEFWHALANVRLSSRPDGALSRTTGFWTELRPAEGRAWRPVDEQVDGGVPTYLMNEAVAIEMEVSATGREHPQMRPDLLDALSVLHELFDVAGRPRVLQLYLESRSDELKGIAHQAAVRG